MNPDTAPLWCLLALYVNLVWFSVLTYLDLRKFTVRLDTLSTHDEFEYTNARLTHLTEHLKKTGTLKPLPKRSSK